MSADDFSSFLAPHCGSLEVHLLGTVELDAMIGLQEYEIYELSGRGTTDGILFLCEHPPCLSMGRESSRSQLPWDEDRHVGEHLPVRWVSRGGGAYAHAPGQVAVYLMIPLRRLGIGLSGFRERFEQAVVLACRDVKVPAKRQSGVPGVWSRNGHVAYFGAAVRSWITCHGMFLNVSIDPQFLRLSETNSLGVPAASMQSQRLDPVPMSNVREALIRRLGEAFGYRSIEVSTGHPLLKRSPKTNPVHV